MRIPLGAFSEPPRTVVVVDMGGGLGSLQRDDDSDGYGGEEKQKDQKLWRTEGHERERERESFGVCVGGVGEWN